MRQRLLRDVEQEQLPEEWTASEDSGSSYTLE